MMPQRQRALYVVVFLAFGFTLISLRLVDIMLFRHDRFEAEATQNHWRSIELPPRRGSIVDATGIELAQTYLLHDIRLDGRNLENPHETLTQIAAILGLDARELIAGFDPQNGYALLKREVDETTVSRLKNLGLRDIICEPKSKRAYPNGGLASQIIGFLDDKRRGAMGIERLMESELRGTPGERLVEIDSRRREIPAFRRKDTAPENGRQVMLTIDLSIQHAVEEQLDKIVLEFQPKKAYAVVIRPQTGEILAMANRPSFNPNERDSIKPGVTRNFCVTDSVEPGSIFKIVPIAAGINDGLITKHTPIYCENGKFFFAGHYLHDHHPYEVLTVSEVMSNSSNIGIAKIALNLGETRLNDYIRAFGFGRKTHFLEGQGESSGLLRPVSRWSKVDVTRIPIGQGIAATPIQIAMSMAAIANGGKLMQPLLVKQIRDGDGRVIKRYLPRMVRRVVSEQTARTVGETLEAVITEGTAKKAKVLGFTAAGKTGTAQKAVNGGYAEGKYIASFMGYVPVEDPQFVVLLMVDEPSGDRYYGGQVAGPAFSELSRKIAQSLGLVPAAQPQVVETASHPQPEATRETY